MASLTNWFHTPLTRVNTAKSSERTPQLPNIRQVTPMPRAAPAGSVLDTAVEPRLDTAASRSRSDGSIAVVSSQ